jgi:hypothetical protein
MGMSNAGRTGCDGNNEHEEQSSFLLNKLAFLSTKGTQNISPDNKQP